jgi:23S rRNA (uracil1939-C5)-methyltransferase
VLCEGALPGERVSAIVTRAIVAEVLEAAPARVDAVCPQVAAGCGGCPWHHVAPEAQPELKAAIVEDALRRIARIPAPPVALAPGDRPRIPPTGYRTGVRLAVDAGGRPCYRRRHGHDLVAVTSCLVADPALADLIVRGRFPGAREVTLRVGAATGERMAFPEPDAGRAVVPPGTVVGRGAAVHEEVDGRRWRISGPSFFQAGRLPAAALAAAVDAAVGPGVRTIVDLYAGVGLLGGVVAARRPGARLVSVEASASASGDAAVNLADLPARVVRRAVAEAAGLPDDADAVIADPPRTGLGRPGAAAVAALGSPLVVLVSCDPASLARDAVLLAGAGYRLDHVEVVDSFPGTFHIETVSRFVIGHA